MPNLNLNLNPNPNSYLTLSLILTPKKKSADLQSPHNMLEKKNGIASPKHKHTDTHIHTDRLHTDQVVI